MDIGSLSPKSDHSEVPKNQQASKKRKVVEKTVVTVKIGTNVGKLLKNEGPPSDSWSWRKYGQKPIKGSPYPRGYYRCSTSKGCSAKKQVERCKTDDSLLIITYTSSHNHPGPQDHHDQDHDRVPPPPSSPKQDQLEEKQDQTITASDDHHDQKDNISANDFHYIIHESPVRYGLELDDQDHFSTTTKEKVLEKTCFEDTNKLGFVLDKEPPLIISGQTQKQLMRNFSSSDHEENDFFDELEELPVYSNFTSFFMRSHLSDEIWNNIPIVPS